MENKTLNSGFVPSS